MLPRPAANSAPAMSQTAGTPSSVDGACVREVGASSPGGAVSRLADKTSWTGVGSIPGWASGVAAAGERAGVAAGPTASLLSSRRDASAESAVTSAAAGAGRAVLVGRGVAEGVDVGRGVEVGFGVAVRIGIVAGMDVAIAVGGGGRVAVAVGLGRGGPLRLMLSRQTVAGALAVADRRTRRLAVPAGRLAISAKRL